MGKDLAWSGFTGTLPVPSGFPDANRLRRKRQSPPQPVGRVRSAMVVAAHYQCVMHVCVRYVSSNSLGEDTMTKFALTLRASR